MLTALDAVDWSGLTHAHGEADDVPELIGRLAEDDWDEAVDELYTALLHEQRVYPATLAALPFLVQVALDGESPGQLGALQLIDAFAGFAAAHGPQALAALQESARALAPLAADPDPDVRAAIYRAACDWPDPAGMLRERLTLEDDPQVRLDLVRSLARIDALTAADLDGFAAAGLDEVVFTGAWAIVAQGQEAPGALEHLARLWPSQAEAYYGAGGGYPLSSLVQEAAGRAVPLLDRLAAEPGIGLGELIWAWHDAARLSRSATGPARQALLALAGRPGLSAEDADELLGALLQVLPADPGPEVAEALVRLSQSLPSSPESQAALAVALFAVRDVRWAKPALALTAAPEVPWVTLGGTSLEFPLALQRVGPVSETMGLVEVARAAISAWPDTVGAWVGLLEQLTPSPEIVQILTEAPVPVKPAMRLLARTAQQCPAAFDVATYQAVRALPVPGGDAGAWLLVTQALLDSGDPAAFARAWRVSESGEGEDELIRIWATHPSPELHRVCLELATKTNWGVYRSRAVQVAAMEILLGGPADEDLRQAVWPALVSLLEVPGAFADAVALGNRLVVAQPELRPQWLAQLWKQAEAGQFVSVAAVAALQALGDVLPEQALEKVAAGLTAVAGTRRVVDTVPAAVRVVRTALGERPDLRSWASGLLAPLIAADERILAPGDVRTDTGLVRILHDAFTG